ncbi:MAG: hypothetical protein IT357_18075 [Gemmatimonadaceae bacterium]|nr:hypothetical protein [Gemmatimonadaceae bacterium]
MPGPLLAVVFWSAVLAVVFSQVMILRSSARVLKAAVPKNSAIEWVFAVGPAIALVFVLVFSWRAAMRPPSVEMQMMPTPGEIRL